MLTLFVAEEPFWRTCTNRSAAWVLYLKPFCCRADLGKTLTPKGLLSNSLLSSLSSREKGGQRRRVVPGGIQLPLVLPWIFASAREPSKSRTMWFHSFQNQSHHPETFVSGILYGLIVELALPEANIASIYHMVGRLSRFLLGWRNLEGAMLLLLVSGRVQHILTIRFSKPWRSPQNLPRPCGSMSACWWIALQECNNLTWIRSSKWTPTRMVKLSRLSHVWIDNMVTRKISKNLMAAFKMVLGCWIVFFLEML